MSEPGTNDLAELLGECVQRDASDLHLAPGLPPYFRVHGVLAPVAERDLISSEKLERLAQELMIPYNAAPLQNTGSLDGAISASDGTRFRFNVFRRQGHLAIALRR